MVIVYSEEETLEANKLNSLQTKTKENQQNKIELINRIKERYLECGSITVVSNEYNLDRHKVTNYIKNGYRPVIRKSISGLDEYSNMINKKCKLIKIYEYLKTIGYNQTYSNLKMYIHYNKNHNIKKRNSISRNDLLKLLYDKGINDIKLNNEQQKLLKEFFKKNRYIRKIFELATEFRIIMFSKKIDMFESWYQKAKTFTKLQNLESFLNGIERDIIAVKNSIIYDYSNGRIEGKVNKIKSIRKRMFNRCTFDFFRNKFFLTQNQLS